MSASTMILTSSLEAHLGLPAELLTGLGDVALQGVDLGRPVVAGIDLDVLLEVAEAGMLERRRQRTRARCASRRSRSRSRPARRRPSSAASRGRSRGRTPSRGGRRGCRGRACPGGPRLIRATARVIFRVTKVSPRRGDSWLKRIPLRDVHPVGLAVVDGEPVRGDLGDRVGAARIEGARLRLRRRGRAEHLRRPGLIDARLRARLANRVEHPQGAGAGDVERVLGDLEGDLDVATGRRGCRSRPAAARRSGGSGRPGPRGRRSG